MTGSGLLAKRPRLREDLVFSRPLQRGPAAVYLVKDRRSGREFEIAAKEQFLVRRLDGVRSLAEITAEYATEFGRRLNDDHWIRLLWLLHERDLLSKDAAEPVAQPGGAGQAAVGRWARRLRWALHPAVSTLLCVLVAAVLAAILLRLGPLWQAARPAFTDPVSLLALVLLAWLGAALHEFAHALVAVHHGATVSRVNLLTLTCRVDDYLYLPQRSQQVAIAAAGAVANGVVLLLVGGALAVMPGGIADRLLGAYLLVGGAQTLVNLVPLPPLDGYKIVSHLLGMLNLAPESRRYLYTIPRRLLLRAGPRYPRRAAINLALYGVWWLFAVAAVAAAMIYLVGALLQPVSGVLAYVLPATIVALTLAGWLARPRRVRSVDRMLSPPSPTGQPVKGESMPPSDGPAIVLDAVSKSYGEVRAVDDISVSIGRGEFFGLVGPNGAGKTTLIEMIEGLRTPDTGTVTVLGMSPAPRNLDLLPLIGVQTQRSAFFTRLTAREHLVTVAALYGLPVAAADRALELVGLTGSAAIRVTNVSGGQRQRLAIASALVHDPQVIFLDEPTAALDPQARRDLGQMLRELKASGKTIVYTTHHLDEAQVLCDRVAILSAGRILALDAPRALIARSGIGTRLVVPAGRLSPERAGQLDGVEGVDIEDGAIVLHTTKSARVLAALGAEGGLDDVETRPATLEDVYLELMGAPQA